MWKRTRKAYWILTTFVSAFTLMLLVNRLGIDGPADWLLPCAAMLILAFFMALGPRRLKKSWARQYLSNVAIQKEQTYILGPEGFEAHSENGDSRYRWDELHAWLEKYETFQIYPSENFMFFIPFSAFQGDQAAMNAARFYLSRLPRFRRKKSAALRISLIILAVVSVFLLITALAGLVTQGILSMR